MEILFVEDELELAGVGASQLRAKGYTVHIARTIGEAHEAVDNPDLKIDFVISDHRLPDGFGIEFIIQLRDTRPNFRCAVVSGCLTEDDIERLEARNITYYFKPLLYTRVIRDLRMETTKRSFPSDQSTDEEKMRGRSGNDRSNLVKKKFRLWPFEKK